LLNEALTGATPSALVNASDYTVKDRQPVEGAANNQPQLPSLFLYLLNHFSKAMVNQYINECAAAPKSAEPVGIMAAQVFSVAAFHWRGESLIDILMAKFRVSCPVLFGYNGKDTTEQGRARLGWKKEYGQWVPEQQHTDRMKGLGVGYASIALRNFSKSKSVNPWPPYHYWASLSSIVNTSPADISDTQCVVLRSMIYLYEEKFLALYGNAAAVALRSALVDFPAKAPKKTTSVNGLSVLAEVYKRDFGLNLALSLQ
jgi:nucleoporin GLE1